MCLNIVYKYRLYRSMHRLRNKCNFKASIAILQHDLYTYYFRNVYTAEVSWFNETLTTQTMFLKVFCNPVAHHAQEKVSQTLAYAMHMLCLVTFKILVKSSSMRTLQQRRQRQQPPLHIEDTVLLTEGKKQAINGSPHRKSAIKYLDFSATIIDFYAFLKLPKRVPFFFFFLPLPSPGQAEKPPPVGHPGRTQRPREAAAARIAGSRGAWGRRLGAP